VTLGWLVGMQHAESWLYTKLPQEAGETCLQGIDTFECLLETTQRVRPEAGREGKKQPLTAAISSFCLARPNFSFSARPPAPAPQQP
jgi:hypothetical protein